MPALHLFDRRTLLAGDDLQLPSLAWGILSFLQIFVLLPILLWFDVQLLLLRHSDDSRQWRMTMSNDEYTIDSQSLLVMNSPECSEATSNYTEMNFPSLLLVFLVGASISCSVSLWYEQRIFQLSSLGTPTLNLHLRHPLRRLIEVKLTYLMGYNLVLLTFGSACTIHFVGEYLHCFPLLWWICWFTFLTIQTFQSLFAITSLVSILRIQPRNALNEPIMMGGDTDNLYQQHTNTMDMHNSNEAEELWRTRCEGCCRTLAISTCFFFGGQSIVSTSEGQKFYGDISRALADYFAGFDGEGLDVVPSDVVLGFVVLRHMQAQRKLVAKREALGQLGYGSRPGSCVDLTRAVDNNSARDSNKRTLFFRWRNSSSNEQYVVEEPSSPLRQESNNSANTPTSPSRADEEYQSFSRIVLSPSNANDLLAIEEGAYFARHQLAIYTWMLYYYEYPFTGTFRLIGRSLKEKMGCSDATLHRDQQTTIVGDNFLRIHEATMCAHAGLVKSDIAYASFEAGFYETPYCIIIDRTWKSVVLSIRGSLTLEDCVVDVLLDPSPLDSLGEQHGFAGSGQYCHGGVYECTQWLYGDLER